MLKNLIENGKLNNFKKEDLSFKNNKEFYGFIAFATGIALSVILFSAFHNPSKISLTKYETDSIAFFEKYDPERKENA